MKKIRISKMKSYICIKGKDIEITLDLNIRGSGLNNENLKDLLQIIKKKSMEIFNHMDDYGESLIYDLLLSYDHIDLVKLEIREENALGFFTYTFGRKRQRAYIGIGSNMGDRLNNIERSMEEMGNVSGIKIVRKSQIIETKAWGLEDQDNFLNCVVEIETILRPQELLSTLNGIEGKLKRNRIKKWGPRTIDLDILLFGREVIYEDNLIVPHPYLHKREFVLESLNELSPHFIHPILDRSMGELLDSLK